MGFADYAFNKSHSACYGLIAYQTAYLKANYPSAFMAALMTSDFDDTDRLAIEMSECQHMGIDVLPPDINESFVEFAVVPGKNQIRFGMAAIKNVGKGAVEEILRARDEEGEFKSLEDFFTKVNSRVVNRKTIESLIKTGAFDRFDTRSKLLNNIDVLLSYSQKKQKEKDIGQTDIFGDSNLDQEKTSEINLGIEDDVYTSKDYLGWERELLGLYLSSHPLSDFDTILGDITHPISDLEAKHEGKSARIGGIVSASRVIQTKNGKNMAFVTLADKLGEVELIVFPKTYDETSWLWEIDKVLVVEGKIDCKDKNGDPTEEVKILVSKAREITYDEAKNYTPSSKKSPKSFEEQKPKKNKKTKEIKKPNRIYLRMNDTSDDGKLKALKSHISNNEGDSEIVLVIGPQDNKQAIKIPYKTKADNDSIDKLVDLFGSENVKVSA